MMGTYIFYTDEGYTIAPNGESLESLQILGIEDGATEDEAWMNLYKNNEWIKENEFRESRIRCYAILRPNVLNDINTLIQYLFADEYKHWEECEFPDNHIFHILKRIQENIELYHAPQWRKIDD